MSGRTEIDSVYGWHSIVHRMCQEFNYKPFEVWKENYISILNYLSYLHQVQEVKNNNNK